MKKLNVHVLKTEIEYFENVVSGKKRFEVRENDRNFKPGDIGVLWSNHVPFNAEFLANSELSPIVFIFEIGFVLDEKSGFCKEGFVTFSILESNLAEMMRITLCKHLMNFDYTQNNMFNFSHLKK